MKILSNIRGIIRNAHPEHHAIAKSMMSIALFVFLGKLAGAAKEMVIAYRYGVSAEVDAYLLVFNLISWPTAVWFSVLTVTLIPLAARIRHDNRINIVQFRAELLAFSLLLGLILAIVAGLGLPALLNSDWLGLSEASKIVARSVIPSMLVLAPLGVLISLFSAWLMSAEQHINTLLESVPALTILSIVLLLPNQGIEALVWGTVAGLSLHLVSLAIPLIKQGNIEKPRFTQHAPQWFSFWQGFGIMLAGQLLMSFTTLIDQFFAAHLDTGAIATLSYANRILALILGLGATTISRATLPVFSRIHAVDEENKLRKIASHWTGLLFIIGTLATLVAWWLAPWGVKLLFERGKFIAHDTAVVTEILRYGLVQLPFYLVGILFISLLICQSRYKTVSFIGIINLIVKVVANFLLVDRLGVAGIMLATAVMYMTSTLLLGIIMYINLNKVEARNENNKSI